MHTENQIDINGPADRVYELAADIAHWPSLLPHYRYVRVLRDAGLCRAAEMGALRNRFPCRWVAEQELFPKERRITFRHVGGISKGMWVEWRIEESGGIAHVTIAHDLSSRIPLVGPPFAKYVIGDLFVSSIAGRTLDRFKRIVEAES